MRGGLQRSLNVEVDGRFSAMSGSSGSGPPVSIADSRSPSADHLARAQQDRLGDRDAECLGGLEVDNEFEMRRLLNRRSPGFAP